MTDDTTLATAAAGHDARDAAGPFARLVGELSELGYEPSPDPTTGATVYTATDSRVVVCIDHGPDNPHVCLSSNDDSPKWSVHWTAGTPTATQLLMLYAVLNLDPAEAITAAASALGLPQPT
ncbi:MAG TPA: hypothetical protein VFC00_03170 [Micromonosporaceae bacterium]|nr:hypothetical protein [Micromonosporaceae bacterium]